MARDKSYKPEGHSIVTIPVTPELHKRLRIEAARRETTIKKLATEFFEDGLARSEIPNARA